MKMCFFWMHWTGELPFYRVYIMDAKKLLLIKSLVTSRPVSSCFREIAELIEKGQVLYSDKHFHSHN